MKQPLGIGGGTAIGRLRGRGNSPFRAFPAAAFAKAVFDAAACNAQARGRHSSCKGCACENKRGPFLLAGDQAAVPHCALSIARSGRIIDRTISSWPRVYSRKRASFSALLGGLVAGFHG
jgi:hypothetical protein